MFNLLFNPVFFWGLVVAFMVLLAVFWINRQRLSRKERVIFALILTVLMVYLIFMGWLIVGFGSSHPYGEPTPILKGGR